MNLKKKKKKENWAEMLLVQGEEEDWAPGKSGMYVGTPRASPCSAKCVLFLLMFKAAHGSPQTSWYCFPRGITWLLSSCGFPLSVITAVPPTIQLESSIWTHFSLPLKRQFEHQSLEEESYGREGSLWVTVICWTSVSKYIRFSLEPISQSITVIFHRWMDGQTSNKMSYRFSSREVQVQRCLEVPSSSVILWMCDWYFGNRDISWYICQWLAIFMKIQYGLGKASRKYELSRGTWGRDKLVIRWHR